MKIRRILLIDDDADEFDFFQDAIGRWPGHFDCCYAPNAQAALGMVRDAIPDFIFMDMNMPVNNGLECMRMMKRIPGLANIPTFIYTTGYTEELHELAVSQGAAGCIRKPTNPASMGAMLKLLYNTGIPKAEREESRLT